MWIKYVVNKGISHFAKCMEPIIPLLLAAGIIKILVLLLSMAGVLADGGSTKEILRMISDSMFYFMPLLVAYSSAVHFQTDPLYAIAAVCPMLYPDFIALMESTEAVTFVGIPVIKASYASTVLPVILLVFIMSLILKALQKKLSNTGAIFVPFLTIISTALLGILLVGPASAAASEALADGISLLYGTYPVIACAVLGFALPVMVITGVHWVFVTVSLMHLSLEGADPFFLSCCFNMNMALTASMLVVYMKSNRSKTALSAGITVLTTGISEPALFGVCVPEKTPLVACMIAGGISGAYQGFVSVNCYIYSVTNIFSILMFADPSDSSNLYQALTAGGIAFAAALVGTFLLYKGRKDNQKG